MFWLKRKVVAAPNEQPGDCHGQKHPGEERIERLVGRFGTDVAMVRDAAAEDLTEIGGMPNVKISAPSEVTAEAQRNSTTSIPISVPETEEEIGKRLLTELNGVPKNIGRREYLSGVDPSEYEDILPVFLEETERFGGKPGGDLTAVAAKIMGIFQNGCGFTPAHFAAIKPYVLQFIKDIRDSAVRIGGGEEAINDGGPHAEPMAVSPFVTIQRTQDQAAPEPVPYASNIARLPRKVDISGVAEPVLLSPPMRVIAIACQKGGAGKTTIAAHLGVCASAAAYGPAVLIDTDPQGSLGEWWRARHDEAPALAKVKPSELAANLAELRRYGTAVTIIDTPPALTNQIEQVIVNADLVLIPVRPSPHDLRAVGATVEMVRRAGRPFLFVVNGAVPRASITAQAVAALSEHGQVAPIILYHRTEYAASMTDGRTVMETAAAGRSAREITGLWHHVYEQLSVRAAAE